MSPILLLHRPEDSYAAEIVRAALVRSFSSAQVAVADYTASDPVQTDAVLINPPDTECARLRRLLSRPAKVLALGRLGPGVASALGLRCDPAIHLSPDRAEAPVAPGEACNLSPLFIRYTRGHPLGRAAAVNPRHFCRYDFADEWNNLGYGRITVDGGAWSLAGRVSVDGATPIACVADADDPCRCAYAALLDTPSAAALWYNRCVGPVDSLEWRVVEAFFGDYRPDELPCRPYLSEAPYGYDGAATVRLDCDQAVASARPLLDLYASEALRLSLAVPAALPLDADDRRLLRDVIARGGCVVSHSVDHPPNWGRDYAEALRQATASRERLEETLPECRPVRHAVSPFHQNPPYAVQALADAGYRGFVGGIIHNDPEFLLGRAGRVPFISRAMVSHSEQCMLHGDCYHRAGGSIETYRQAFDNALSARAIFGCLDHPFSRAYAYGWASESERLRAHAELIRHIRSHRAVWWCTLNECLDFLCMRDAASLRLDDRGQIALQYAPQRGLPPLAVMWKGRVVCAPPA